MNKQDLITFFDKAAPDWDAHMVTDERKIAYILDRSAIHAGQVVLDVACGTGVLFPYYLQRNVSQVIGVDISQQMARIAGEKNHDPRVHVLCGDIETLPVYESCDRCVIYNAFPHFENPERLLSHLAQWVKPGGRLTVAHSMSLEALHRHHAGHARHISRPMLPPQELAALFAPWFEADMLLSDEEKYIVSGIRLS